MTDQYVGFDELTDDDLMDVDGGILCCCLLGALVVGALAVGGLCLLGAAAVAIRPPVTTTTSCTCNCGSYNPVCPA
ncbi:MAG: hypothetical protein FWF75_01160 [Propionibacteriaceae bacterium]|nr:hypothetical protein [Propionibacteriaceae bacterium]